MEIKNSEKKDYSILIVEDNLHSMEVLKEMLVNEDYNILWANNGLVGVKMAAKESVDLILMDIKMPELDGIQAMKKIKKIKPNIPIIAQTAFTMADENKELLDLGFDAYLSKPILLDELLLTVRNILE